MNEWAWSIGGKWLWQSTAEELGEIPNSNYSTFDPKRIGLGSKSDRPLIKSAIVLSGRNINIPLSSHCTDWASLPPPQTEALHVMSIRNLFLSVNKTQGKADGLVFRRVFYKIVLVIMIRMNRWKYNINSTRITQRGVVISYRRFGTAYRPNVLD